MSAPTRYPNGLTTAAKNTPMGEFILPDMTKAHVYMEDFDYYTAADWTTFEFGTPTQALTDGDGGRLLITNSAANDDRSFQQKVGESFLFEAGKKLWFDCVLQVSDAIESDFTAGLQITNTAPLNPTDGVFFVKTDAANTVDLMVKKDSVVTITSSIATISDNTDIRLSYFYNGIDIIEIFANGVFVGSSVVTNLPDDEVMTISFGVQNGEAVSKTMTMDYVMAAKAR